jgi:hypothetical protein
VWKVLMQDPKAEIRWPWLVNQYKWQWTVLAALYQFRDAEDIALMGDLLEEYRQKRGRLTAKEAIHLIRIGVAKKRELTKKEAEGPNQSPNVSDSARIAEEEL